MRGDLDAVVVGSGPNGLAAAVTMAAAGLRVQVIEGAPTIGGGCRTEELTLPGFWHDVCSAAHPLAVASPFFQRFDLAARGVALALARGGVRSAAGRGPGRGRVPLGRTTRPPGSAPTAAPTGACSARSPSTSTRSCQAILAPLRRPPAHPLVLASYGRRAILPASVVARRWHTQEARAIMAGAAAHAMMPLTAVPTAGVGLMLIGLAHAVGWPVVAGGSARITDAMAACPGRRRRQHRDRPLGPLAGRTSFRPRRPPRRLAPDAGAAGRRPAARPVPRRAAPVPLRPGGLQGRLRPVRPGAVDQRGLPPGRNPAPRRPLRAGRRGRGRSGRGQAPAGPVRARGPARRRRSVPRPGRPADPVDLLSRAVRIRAST